MAADPGVRLVERYVDIVNGGDLDQLAALFAPDFVQHRPTGTEVGLGPLRAFVESVRRVLPDLVMRLDVVFADPAFPDGARIGALVTQSGTSAQLGRRVTFREVHVYRIAGGKIAERWFAVDRAAFPAVVPADG
jgi:ketosteroid isomerase-like protein